MSEMLFFRTQPHVQYASPFGITVVKPRSLNVRLSYNIRDTAKLNTLNCLVLLQTEPQPFDITQRLSLLPM